MLVDDGAEDDLSLGIGGFADQLRRLVDLVQGEVGPARDVEQDSLGPGDRRLEQRAGHGVARGVRRPCVAGAEADAHQRLTLPLHHGLDVREVEVDHARIHDEIADALHALTEHVIRNLERLDDRRFLLHHLLETLVRDRDQCVDAPLQIRGALFRRLLPPQPLEAKRLGDHADGEGARLPRDLRDHGRGAGSRATTHARSDEDHVAVAERLGQLVARLLRRLLPDVRVAAGP